MGDWVPVDAAPPIPYQHELIERGTLFYRYQHAAREEGLRWSRALRTREIYRCEDFPDLRGDRSEGLPQSYTEDPIQLWRTGVLAKMDESALWAWFLDGRGEPQPERERQCHIRRTARRKTSLPVTLRLEPRENWNDNIATLFTSNPAHLLWEGEFISSRGIWTSTEPYGRQPNIVGSTRLKGNEGKTATIAVGARVFPNYIHADGWVYIYGFATTGSTLLTDNRRRYVVRGWVRSEYVECT